MPYMGYMDGLRPITSGNTRQWSIGCTPNKEIILTPPRAKGSTKLQDKSTENLKRFNSEGFKQKLINEIIQLRLNKGKVDEGKVELTVFGSKNNGKFESKQIFLSSGDVNVLFLHRNPDCEFPKSDQKRTKF